MSAKPFNQVITAFRFGTLNDDLTKAMQELTNKCSDTGRVGDLTLKLTFKPGKGGQIEIIDDIKLKLPKEERGTTLMFATPEGNLQRDDPRQLKLDGLRSVDQETGELKKVS